MLKIHVLHTPSSIFENPFIDVCKNVMWGKISTEYWNNLISIQN